MCYPLNFDGTGARQLPSTTGNVPVTSKVTLEYLFCTQKSSAG